MNTLTEMANNFKQQQKKLDCYYLTGILQSSQGHF